MLRYCNPSSGHRERVAQHVTPDVRPPHRRRHDEDGRLRHIKLNA